MIDLKLSDSTLRDLSNNDMRILNYIYRNSPGIHNLDIKTFSGAIPCSASSIVRFCKKIGFTGFPELKYYLIQNTTIDQTKNVTIQPTFSEIIRNMNTEIKGTLSLVGSDDLYRTAVLLTKNIPVYVFLPGGITDTISIYFAKLFMSHGRQNVYQLASSKMTIHKMSILAPNSIMVFISSSGKWGKTIELAKMAKLRNLTVVSFSPYNVNELSKYSDYNIRFFSETRLKDTAEYTSRLPIFFIINALIEYYCSIKASIPHD